MRSTIYQLLLVFETFFTEIAYRVMMAIRYDCNRLPLRMNIILFHLRERYLTINTKENFLPKPISREQTTLKPRNIQIDPIK